MPRLASALVLSALTLVAASGCAAPDEGRIGGSSDDVVLADDGNVVQEITAAIAGLETSGSEGDPDPYKVLELELPKSTPMTPELLVAELLPKMEGFHHDEPSEDYKPGHEPGTVEGFFSGTEVDPADYEGDPEGLAAAMAAKDKWVALRAIVERDLTDVVALKIGYVYEAGSYSSIETGAVALTLAGRTSTGRVVAIYGIVIWT